MPASIDLRLFVALALLGCNGVIGDSPSIGGGGPDVPFIIPDEPVRTAPQAPELVPSTTTRQLSNTELENSLLALTGIRPDALTLLPPESDVSFDRVVNGQTVSRAHLDAYLAIGAEVADALLQEQGLDEITDACPDESLPPLTGATEQTIRGDGLNADPTWAVSLDGSRLRIQYAERPVVTATYAFPAAGTYEIALETQLSAGAIAGIELLIDGERAHSFNGQSGPSTYRVQLERDAPSEGVTSLQFRIAANASLLLFIDSLTITGPLDGAAMGGSDAERRACAQGLVETLAERAYRRPTTEAERAQLMALYDLGAEGGDGANALSMVIQAILASPNFIYLVEVGEPSDDGRHSLTPWETAARLSYALCESPPDDELRSAAAAGNLARPAEREAQARRLLDLPCGRRTVQRFMEQWFRVDRVDEVNKSPEVFPAFTGAVRAQLAEDVRTYFDEMLWSEEADLRGLYGANVAWPSAETAFLYDLPPGTEGRTVLPERRAGILTHPAWLAVTSAFEETSPVARGVFVLEHVLCEELGAVPENVDITPPLPDPSLTTRERWAAHSESPACRGCHTLIDPIGFALEEFDAVGQHRTEEFGMPIDSSGGVPSIGIDDGELNGGAALSDAVANAEGIDRCFSRHWFRFALGRLESQGDVEALEQTASVAASDSIVEALIALTRTDAFVTRYESEEL
ncbi:MAG: DUF1588 domain-containing protein [Myxococcota bacterium]